MSETSKNTCRSANPLVREGTSQKSRLLAALQSGYVQVDEHSAEDLLVFARRYAEHLKYFDLEDQLRGDWRDFFKEDVSILIALLSKTDLDVFRATYEVIASDLNVQLADLYTQVDGSGDLLTSVTDDLPATIPAFKQVFDFILSVATHLDEQVVNLPDSTGLRDFAKSTIRKECGRAFHRLLGYYKAGVDEFGVIDPSQQQPIEELSEVDQKYTQTVLQKGLKMNWLPEPLKWQDYYDTVVVAGDFVSAYGGDSDPLLRPEEVEERIRPVLKPIESAFGQLLKAFEKILFEAPQYLEETLDEWPDHKPHIALYLVFIKLFRFAQEYMNGLKERHLDYYYKEVLRLKEKGATPDEVHLLIELAKQVEEHVLASGTAFKAGKDALGKEVQYTLPSETSFNKASVASLKSLYYTKVNSRLYAAPVANSKDGRGEKLDNEDGSWKPFGPITQFRGGENTLNPEIPVTPTSDEDAVALFSTVNKTAWAGFAIATPNLYLREGTRTIHLTFSITKIDDLLPDPVTAGWDLGDFKLLFSGEEGWIEKQATAVPVLAGSELQFTCVLQADDLAVVPYNADLHGGRFHTSHPVVQVLVGTFGSNSPYEALQNFKVTTVKTRVEVRGVKNVIIQNNLGQLDPSKPFNPFGPIPYIGSQFIIGSHEIFQKKLTGTLTFRFEWDGLSDFTDKFEPNSNVFVSVKNLHGLGDSNKQIFSTSLSGSNVAVQASFYGENDFLGFDYTEDRAYSVEEQDGYVVMTLLDGFGHQIYTKELPLALIQFAKDVADRDGTLICNLNKNFKNSSGGGGFGGGGGGVFQLFNIISSGTGGVGTDFGIIDDLFTSTLAICDTEAIKDKLVIPDPPYTPLTKSLAIDYDAESTFSVTGSENTFNNRGEFFYHVFPFGEREEHNFLREGRDVPLIPEIKNEGELYVGLARAQAQQVVSLLFQVLEGSANPLRNVQDVNWHYLSNNHWKAFKTSEMADTTNGLLQSGIIQFDLPKKVTVSNTWLDPDHVWIRASIQEFSDAICDLVLVAAQAARATFNDRDNAEDFLATVLESGTISKLVRSNSAVKKIQQPFASFGGKVAEAPDHFYKRVSERLRHKDRAITIWDYEHLVLEAFPEIYKVKCLNHTRIQPDCEDDEVLVDNEKAPGHVLVVTIPDLKNRNAVNPLKPYTSLGTLDNIHNFLAERISAHVQLKVANPRFETIQLDFSVRFHIGKDATIYEKILNQDIIRFLSPWAYQTEQEISFGGKLHKSVLLDYVEELPYVDFLIDFKMNQNPDDLNDPKMDINEAVASTGRSVLVSHQKHIINIAGPECG